MDDVTENKVDEWMRVALEDYAAALSLLNHEPSLGSSICFHAQQFVEKSLKAFLTLHNLHIEKTHDLQKLINQCAQVDIEFQNYEDDSILLTPYATRTRYPDDYRPILIEESYDIFHKAERIYNFIKSKLDPQILI